MFGKKNLIPLLLFASVSAGCTASLINVKHAQDAASFAELQKLFGELQCVNANHIKKCFHYSSSFNIFALESHSQMYYFNVDNHDKIVWKELTEIRKSYYPFVRFGLPDSFNDFR